MKTRRQINNNPNAQCSKQILRCIYSSSDTRKWLTAEDGVHVRTLRPVQSPVGPSSAALTDASNTRRPFRDQQVLQSQDGNEAAGLKPQQLVNRSTVFFTLFWQETTGDVGATVAGVFSQHRFNSCQHLTISSLCFHSSGRWQHFSSRSILQKGYINLTLTWSQISLVQAATSTCARLENPAMSTLKSGRTDDSV